MHRVQQLTSSRELAGKWFPARLGGGIYILNCGALHHLGHGPHKRSNACPHWCRSANYICVDTDPCLCES